MCCYICTSHNSTTNFSTQNTPILTSRWTIPMDYIVHRIWSHHLGGVRLPHAVLGNLKVADFDVIGQLPTCLVSRGIWRCPPFDIECMTSLSSPENHIWEEIVVYVHLSTWPSPRVCGHFNPSHQDPLPRLKNTVFDASTKDYKILRIRKKLEAFMGLYSPFCVPPYVFLYAMNALNPPHNPRMLVCFSSLCSKHTVSWLTYSYFHQVDRL